MYIQILQNENIQFIMNIKVVKFHYRDDSMIDTNVKDHNGCPNSKWCRLFKCNARETGIKTKGLKTISVLSFKLLHDKLDLQKSYNCHLATRYARCISSSKSTCDVSFLEPKKPVGSYSDCEKQCDEDIKCKFIFHIPGVNCNRYASCDTLRKTNYKGSTYSKYGNCPGSKNGHMSV